MAIDALRVRRQGVKYGKKGRGAISCGLSHLWMSDAARTFNPPLVSR
jgi:hypothetical protein